MKYCPISLECLHIPFYWTMHWLRCNNISSKIAQRNNLLSWFSNGLPWSVITPKIGLVLLSIILDLFRYRFWYIAVSLRFYKSNLCSKYLASADITSSARKKRFNACFYYMITTIPPLTSSLLFSFSAPWSDWWR